jgi:DNA-binding transcriptional MerR regulator
MKRAGVVLQLTTGDLARETGNTLRTVRFYEEAGLLRPTTRGRGGRRGYGEEDLVRLQFITDLRALDLPLDEIRRLLELKRTCRTPRELKGRLEKALQDQIEVASRRLEALKRLRDEIGASLASLEACRACEAPLQADECPHCNVVSGEKAPRLMRVVLGRRRPCSDLLARTRKPAAK